MSIKADMNWLMGCLFDEKKRDYITGLQPRPAFGTAAAEFGIVGSGRGKTVHLWKCIEQLNGQYNTRRQEDSDCVSQGTATTVDIVKSVEIVVNDELEEWTGETCTEPIYGGSRVQVGKGQLGKGGGSYGGWAAQFCKQFGCFSRGIYGRYDLSKYDVNKVRLWATQGCPQELLNISKEHPIKAISRIHNYYEAIDSLANGYSLTICSNQGFTTVRDKDGFCNPDGIWPHCMACVGFDDNSKRPGIEISNSWGLYIGGKPKFDEPASIFFCDAEVFDKMCNQQGSECWSFSDYNGYPQKKLDLRIF